MKKNYDSLLFCIQKNCNFKIFIMWDMRSHSGDYKEYYLWEFDDKWSSRSSPMKLAACFLVSWLTEDGRQYVHSKCWWISTGPHGVTSEMVLLIFTIFHKCSCSCIWDMTLYPCCIYAYRFFSLDSLKVLKERQTRKCIHKLSYIVNFIFAKF
jgi:hypothetical protein